MALLLRRFRRSFLSSFFPRSFFGLVFIYVYCEYLIYYVTQIQCGWATLSKEPNDGVEPVYAMVIADTHLLGSRNGHWFDKWRREWQMHRAFQTAMTLHSPDVVFVLGDLFDEGKWCPEKEFNDYVERFYKLFKVPDGTAMYSVVGNHDIGYHYSKKLEREVRIAGPIKSDVFRRITPHLAKRFESRLKAPPVQLVSIRGNHFVLINSMAMEGDGCTLCARTVAEIANISNILKCSSGSSLCKGKKKLERYSRPIVMQHYPLYRESDNVCTEPDAAPLPERNSLFEERWDCLSKESTEYLVESLHPRAAFGAHTHHSCVVRHSFVPTPDHKIEFVEYTVPSFSWRNRLDPKYYLCGWATLSKEPNDGVEPVYAMVIADTHLLGSRNGHWFDKWRREWQMHRAFQTAMTLHSPDVVFVLGDLFDEGKWCPEKEFNDYVERFYKLFKVPDGTAMYSVVGNHDIGYHYRITPHLAKRFESRLKAPPVQLVSIRGNHFVLINSMAMEGDGCTLCARTVAEIANISNILKCSSGSSLCKGKKKLERYSRPIVMQHYPLYRESDNVCTEPDAAPLPERNSLFEERWDCLSKESTEYLVESLHPRAAFGAHTHHSCVVRHSFVPTPDHKIEFVEYTVPSFSWRNRLDPKYYLLTITPEEVKVSKCGMPREWTLQITAILMTLALLVYLRYYATVNTLSYKQLSGKKV